MERALTHETAATEDERFFEDLRAREFGRLDATGTCYLDYTGAALYAESHIRAHEALLCRGVFGNPHSEHPASAATMRPIEAARQRVLRWLDANDDYAVCFTANASAAIKLVAEAYPFRPGISCVLSADNHNSVNGVREYARRAGSEVQYLPLTPELRLSEPETRLRDLGANEGGLLLFPAQSNFSGVQHPLSLVATAQSHGYRVLLDAAAFVPGHRLDLGTCRPDFVAMSFYKVFGYPTGVGALVARRDALAALARPWFAGGTVDYASVQLRRHQLRPLPDAFEDGTPNFLDILAIAPGFSLREEVGADRIERHIRSLTASLLTIVEGLRHASGAPLVRVYGPVTVDRRGGSIAFNVLDRDGRTVPFGLVEERANAAGVLLRGGCFCNPGAAEAAFQFDERRMAACLASLDRGFSIPGLQRCLGAGVPVGAVRASVGIANNAEDIRRAGEVVASFAA